MKKTDFCIIISSLAVALSFCSCSKKEAIILDTGSHPVVELRMDEPAFKTDKTAVDKQFNDYCDDLVLRENNSRFEVFYDQSRFLIYEYDNGGALSNSIDCVLNKPIDILGVSKKDDNTILLLANDGELNSYIIPITDGAITEYINIGNEKEYRGLFTDTEGNTVLYHDGGIVQLNTDFSEGKKYSTDKIIGDAVICDDMLFEIEYELDESSNDDNGILSYDIEINSLSASKLDKKTVATFNYQAKVSEIEEISLVADKDRLIFSLPEGIFEYSVPEKTVKMLANNVDYGFLFECNLLDVNGNELQAEVEYLDIRTGSFEEKTVTFVSWTSGLEKRNITVGTFGSEDYRDYFCDINRTSDEYYLNLIDFGMYAEEKVDLVKLINNSEELDLVVFDNLLYGSFTSNGLLKDLNGYQIDDSDLIGPIFDLMNTDGHRYCLFPSYGMSFFAYNSELFDPDDIGVDEALNQGSVIALVGNQDISKIAMSSYGLVSKDIHDTGKVSETTIRTYLELCKKYGHSDELRDTMYAEIRDGEILFNLFNVHTVEEYYGMSCYYGTKLGIKEPWGYDSSVVLPNDFIGIYADSSNDDICLEVIELLLSEEYQCFFDLPVNKSAFESKLDHLNGLSEEEAQAIVMEHRLFSTYEQEQYMKNMEAVVSSMQKGNHEVNETAEDEAVLTEIRVVASPELKKVSIDSLYEMVWSASSYEVQDRNILKILMEEANDLIGNSKDIDSVTRSATDRINLYLSETGE